MTESKGFTPHNGPAAPTEVVFSDAHANMWGIDEMAQRYAREGRYLLAAVASLAAGVTPEALQPLLAASGVPWDYADIVQELAVQYLRQGKGVFHG